MKKLFLHNNSISEARAKYLLWGIRIAFFAYCLLAPYGKALQIVPTALGLVLVCAYYATSWRYSNAALLPMKWLWGLFFVFPLISCAYSIDPAYSFKMTLPIYNESIPLFFMALESLRSRRDVCIMGGCLLSSLFVQGLDGVWQYVSGKDLFHRTLVSDWGGRLTGSMGTPRVGNYLGIVIVPSLLSWWILPATWNVLKKSAFLAVILSPALFLLVFSGTRTGILALMVAVVVVAFLILHLSWKILFVPLLFFILSIIVGLGRLNMHNLVQDLRWEHWNSAIHVFLESPLLGFGAASFLPASRSLHGDMAYNIFGVQHPHNMYLQLLSDGGILGFAILGGVLLGIGGIYLGTKIYHKSRQCNGTALSECYTMLILVWGGFIAYLCTGVTGHDFYRTWWLAQGLLFLGASFALYFMCQDAKKSM